MTTRHVPVLDALSIIVMLEHCDFDWTIATFWHTRYRNAAVYGPWDAQVLPAPLKAQWCLHCLLGMVGLSRAADGRADLIDAVKRGDIQIEALALRDDITRCAKCGQLAGKKVNPLWRENL